MFKSNKKAFTLAEVLMSLTIVGVIAAMTIPIINTNTRDKHFDAARKKAFGMGTDAWEYYIATGDIAKGTDSVSEANFKKFAEFFLKAQTSDTSFIDRNGFQWSLVGGKIIADINAEQEPNVIGEDKIELCPNSDTDSLDECAETSENSQEED